MPMKNPAHLGLGIETRALSVHGAEATSKLRYHQRVLFAAGISSASTVRPFDKAGDGNILSCYAGLENGKS